MTIVNINKIGIRRTLIDASSALNVCSIDLLHKINIGPFSLNTSSLVLGSTMLVDNP